MKIKNLKSIALLLLCTMLNINYAWGTDYTLVTDNEDVTDGDVVIISTGTTNGSSTGVTGWNGNKDATVGTTESGWKQFIVGGASASGWTLYDDAAEKYIASPGGNEFKYNTSAGTCSVDANGHLLCNSRVLCINGTNYRFYSSIGTYSPFFVYKIASSCSNKVTITNANLENTVTNGTFTLSRKGEIASCNSNVTVTVTATPDACCSVNTVTASNSNNITNNGDGTYTITYNQNANVSSTIAVTFNAGTAHTVTFSAQGGSCTTPSLTESSPCAGVTLPTATVTCLGWEFAGWKETSAQASASSPSSTLYAAGETYYPTSDCTLYAVYKKGSTGGGTSTITIYPSSYDINNSYGSGVEKTGSASTISLGAHYIMKNTSGTPSGSSYGDYIQAKASDANIYNKTAVPGAITQVVVNQYEGQAMSLYCGTSQLMASDNTSTGQTPSGSKITDVAASTSMTWSVSASKNYTYFDLKKGSSTSYISSIVITYTSVSYTYNSNPTCTDPEMLIDAVGINYGTRVLDSETDEYLTLQAINLNANAILTISGTDAGMFAVEPASITPTARAITGDDNVIVTYNPTAAGTHTATLTITSTGADPLTVDLTGTCELVCTTPVISFEQSTVYKFYGDAPFTNPCTITGNGLGATVTYSSNSAAATVNASTGEVTINDACESGSVVRITASVAEPTPSDVACQYPNSVYYTLIIKNHVNWFVNEEAYTEGTPDTEVYENGTISNLPDAPDGESACGGKVFKGWTNEANKNYSDDAAPTPLYTTASAIPAITANTNFYAVFADEGSGGGSPTLIKMATGDTFEDGDTIVIVAHGTTKALYQQTVNTSYVSGWEFDGSAATVKADAKKSLGVAATEGGWYLGDVVSATNLFLNMGSSNSLYCDADKTVWTLTDNGNGTFCLTSNSTKLSWRSDLGTPRWRGGNNNGVNTLDIYKFSPDGKTYENYSTSCGDCLLPPTPTVAVRSNGATLTWSAVPDATGYEVTCSAGTVIVSETTATISGLSSLTDYTYTIRCTGTDPYTCFPTKRGSFKTADCDNVPILSTPNVTATTASLIWTCPAGGTATVRVYSDAECTVQVGTDHTSATSPLELSGLTSGTTYYYKVLAGGTCSSEVGSLTTEELQLDITEWRENAVVISFNGDADLTLTTFREETHGDPHGNVAEDIFFSKYFEAAASVKLLAIFNGTLDDVDLTNYKLGLAQSSGAEKAFTFTKFSDFVKQNGDKLSADELLLEPNEELILITYTSDDNDQAIINCAENDDEHSKFSSYIRISTPNLQFNGDDAIGLLNSDGDMIDLIGAGTKAGGSSHSGDRFVVYASGTNHKGFMDKPGGWYTSHGYHALADNTEEDEYALSSNRCLLIRRKHVKSGHNAVSLNTTDFVTLGDTTIGLTFYQGEWKGVQIPGTTTTTSDPGITNSCDGFAEVGGYNYNEYYTEFKEDIGSQSFDDFKSNPFDGTYVIPVSRLDTLACAMVRIDLYDGSDNLVIRKDVKVPIMINGDKTTSDEIFHNYHKDALVCKECDVVIFNGATLTKEPDGTTGDVTEVRDLKIYQGGTLVINEDDEYTVNSLAMRRQEDDISLADIQGTLTVNKTKGVSLDLRIDPSNWHFVSLPYDCNISEITFSDGTPATPEVDYLLRWYDGGYRAAHKDGGWTTLTSGTLRKGMGFIVGLPGTDIIKKELRFPMANDVIADEKNDKTVGSVYGYGADKSDEVLTPNHKGWNLIGNPYMMYYSSDLDDPLDVGHLDLVGGVYERSGTLKYLVTPNGWNGMNGYSQVSINSKMKPFTAYFVQIGATTPNTPSTAQNITFNQTSAGKYAAPRRRIQAALLEEEDTHPVWFGIELVNANEEKDNTTLLISNDFTDDYDMMDDLVKMRGPYYRYPSFTTKPVLASRNLKGEMAFNAVPDNTAAEVGVPINYYAAQNGTYTIKVDEHYKLDEIKSALLYDATTKEYFDLLANNEGYLFSTNRGDNTDRFKLFVRVERKKAPEVATDIEDVVDSNEEAPRKFLFNGTIYIQRGNAIYDITGKQLR